MSNKTVLVVEDDASISLGLRINLEKEGYRVIVADNGAAGLESARSNAPDLVILDVMLPEMNGLEVLNTLRTEGHTMPIIMLSARSAEMDKVAGLELGAEDYIAKPFSLAELLARVRAAMRRSNGARPKTHNFGDVVVDPAARVVTKKGAVVDITATELDVLLYLIQSEGKALSREEIFRRVWGAGHHGTARTIDNFIQQLRSKLETSPQDPTHIKTVRGIGYRFDA